MHHELVQEKKNHMLIQLVELGKNTLDKSILKYRSSNINIQGEHSLKRFDRFEDLWRPNSQT